MVPPGRVFSSRVWAIAGLLVLALAAVLDGLGREGVALWGFSLEPLPARALLLGLLAIALLAPHRPLPLPHVYGLALTLLTLVTGWAVLDLRGEAERGSHAPVAATLVPSDGVAPSSLSLAPEVLRGPYRAAQALGKGGGYELRLDGALVAPETGRYALRLGCPSECSLSLEGHPVLAAPGESEIALREGAYSLNASFVARGQGFLRLEWRRPAAVTVGSVYAAIGPSSLAADGAASARAFHERERVALERAARLAAIWLAAALVTLRLGAALAGWRASLTAALRRAVTEPVARRSAAFGLAAALFVTLLRLLASPSAPDGLHLHAWTGEYLMQTVSVADLRIEPVRSLVYNHIQPPLLDALRAMSAQRHRALDGIALENAVDADIYLVWAVVAGLLATLVHEWLHAAAGPRVALAGAVLLILHPAFLFYATFQDSTFPSGAGVAWASYELWRLSRGGGSPGRLALVLSLLFLTRSIVQWPFLLVISASFWLLRVDRRRALRALGPFALVIALFMAKQYALFGLTMTSSFGPDSFCKGLSAFCQGTTPVPLPELPSPMAASALRRIEKLNGEYNWNQLAFLRRSFSQMQEYKALLRETSPGTLLGLVEHTLGHWLKPSSRHSPHVLVDALPWRAPFDFVMSGVPLVLLLLGSAGVVFWRDGLSLAAARRALGLALPCLYVFAVSVIFESGENMRYKFFVEPTLWVLFFTQGTAAVRLLRERR
ncbi:MAG: hypothetical protein AB7O37_22240 [Vicinamibacteria bacterium]